MKTFKRIMIAAIVIAPMLMISCNGSEFSAVGFFSYLTNQMQAGEVAEETVIYMDSNFAAEWIANGSLHPLGDLDTSGLDARLQPYFKRDGQMYALPQNIQTMAMVVNRDLLDEMGLIVPTNWDELMDVARAVRDSGENRFGIALAPSFWNYIPFLYQAGGSIYDGETGAITLDSESAKEAMRFYTDLYRNDLAYPGNSGEFVGAPPTWGIYEEQLNAFAERKVAILFLGPGMYDRLLEKMGLVPSAPYPIEVYNLPVGLRGDQATIGMVRGFAVLGNPEQPLSEATKLFMEYITGPEAARFWVGSENDPTSFVPAALEAQKQWQNIHGNAQAFYEGIEYLVPKSPFPVSRTGMWVFLEKAEPFIIDVMLGKLAPEKAVGLLTETAYAIKEEYQLK